VTTTAYGKGLSRTPKVASARSPPGSVQFAAASELLRDEEAVVSNPAIPTVWWPKLNEAPPLGA
jgi:hypothetical protein